MAKAVRRELERRWAPDSNEGTKIQLTTNCHLLGSGPVHIGRNRHVRTGINHLALASQRPLV